MKTLLITMDFPPLLGGVANYYFNRVCGLQNDDIDILVLANKITDYRLQITDYDFPVIRKIFFTRFIWPHWLPLIWHIWRVVKKEKITKLWAGQVLPVGTAAWMVSSLLSFPRRRESRLLFFVTCHGNDLLRAKSVARKYKLAKKILRDAEFVEANTEFTKNILIQDFGVPVEKIKVVYPECTLRRDQVDNTKVEELREKYNVRGKKVLLTVARLVESKGIGQVLRALPKVWEQVSDLVYLVVGDGPDRENFVGAGRNLPICRKDRIIFTGAIAHNELPNYYALANAFILTPYAGSGVGAGFKPAQDTESFGIVYLEAIEFDLPIIAGDVGGAREIKKSPHFQGGVGVVNNNFILVNSENIDEIAEKIIKVIK